MKKLFKNNFVAVCGAETQQGALVIEKLLEGGAKVIIVAPTQVLVAECMDTQALKGDYSSKIFGFPGDLKCKDTWEIFIADYPAVDTIIFNPDTCLCNRLCIAVDNAEDTDLYDCQSEGDCSIHD